MYSFIQCTYIWPSNHIKLLVVFVMLAVFLAALWWQFWYVDLLKGTDPAEYHEAVKSANDRKHEILPALPFTEKNAAWVLLYDHARRGQIDPSVMKHMHKKDLLFLAGMSFPHPDLTMAKEKEETEPSAKLRHEAATKLIGNATRAKMELDRRSKIRTTIITASAALLGAILGAVLTRR